MVVVVLVAIMEQMEVRVAEVRAMPLVAVTVDQEIHQQHPHHKVLMVVTVLMIIILLAVAVAVVRTALMAVMHLGQMAVTAVQEL